MRPRRHATDGKGFHVVAIMADRLNRVGMKKSFVAFGQFADAPDVEQVPDFVVGVHQRYE